MKQKEALRRSVETALTLTDQQWYYFLLQSDPGSGGLSPAEADLVIRGSMEAGKQQARRLKTAPLGQARLESRLAAGASRQGGLADSSLLARAQILLKELHLTLIPVQEELREPFLYLARLEPDTRQVFFNTSLQEHLVNFIQSRDLEEIIPAEYLAPLTLFHEAFHALEEVTPDIFTRRRMIKRRLLGLFPYQKGLNSAPEIGAVHFSKLMTGLDYSPCIYSQLILVSLEKISLASLTPNVLR